MGPGDRRLDRRAVPALERGLALAAALAGFVAAAGVMTDNSLLTHIATGRVILDGGSVPSVDPYSRFGAGQPWTVQSWLVSVVYGLADRAGGPATVRLFHGLVGAAIGFALWRLSRPAVEIPTRLVLTALPLTVGAGLWSPRPLLVGLAGLVALLLVVREGRPPWLLVPLLWVWANAHGSFPLALVYLVLLTAGRWLDHRRRPSAELALLAWATVGTLLAALGPIGPRLLTFPLQVVAGREAMAGVVEWEAPSFTSPAQLAWLALPAALLVAARRRLALAELVPAAAFAVTASLALRNIAPAAIVVAVSVAPALAGLGPAPRRRRVVDPAVDAGAVDGPASGIGGRIGRAVGVAASVAFAVAVASVAITPGIDLRRYPVDAVDALVDAELLGPGADDVVVAHREAVGNYLTWRFGPRSAVFVDDRFDFHDPGLLADHRDLLAARDPGEVLDRRRVDAVLWESDSPLAAWLDASPHWVVRPGQDWTIACRRSPMVDDACPWPDGPAQLASTDP